MESWSRASYPRIRSKGLCYRIQLQIWMNILSDKFCSWVIGGNSPIYWCKLFKNPFDQAHTHPLLNQPLTFSHTQFHCCVEFETEMTMPPRHIQSISSIHDPLNSSSFYPLYHSRLYFSSNYTLLMFVNIRQRTPYTSPICWFYT